MFQPLTREEVREIVELQFKHVQKMLMENGISLTASEESIDWIAQLGFDPQFGARPLKRVMQKKLLNELSKQILGGKVSNNDHIHVDIDKNKEFVFRNIDSAVEA